MPVDCAPLKYLGQPLSVGAYLISSKREMNPVIMSYSTLLFTKVGTGYGYSLMDVRAISVQPGYRLQLFTSENFGTEFGSDKVFDNVSGAATKLFDYVSGDELPSSSSGVPQSLSSGTTVVSSCKLFYKGIELNGNLSAVNYAYLNPLTNVTSSDIPSPPTTAIALPYTVKNSGTTSFAPVYLTGSKGSYPIFTSIDSYRRYHMGNIDMGLEFYLIAPNFTLITYQWGYEVIEPYYTQTAYSILSAKKYENNTNEWQIFWNHIVIGLWSGYNSSEHYAPNACRLYFHGTEITEDTNVVSKP